MFNRIERHFLAKLPGEADAIITDTKKVVNTLNSLCIEMDQRYDLLKDAQVRNLKEWMCFIHSFDLNAIQLKIKPSESNKIHLILKLILLPQILLVES